MLDYELRLRQDEDGLVDLGEVQALLAQERSKETECAAKLERIRGTVESAETNYRIAADLHDSIGEFLERDGLSEEEQDRFIESAAEAASKITRERKED